MRLEPTERRDVSAEGGVPQIEDALGRRPDAQADTRASKALVEIRREQGRRRRRNRAMFAFVWIGLVGLLIWQFEAAGQLDTEWMKEWGAFIIGGAQVTVLVSLLSILLATALAIVGAIGRISSNPVFGGTASFYVSLVRGTPLLVQIYFVFFALPQVGIVLPPILAGILALGFNRGAYMTEIFRAGLQAVPRGQREAALSFGMRGSLVFRRIIVPQAFRIVLPAIGNEFIGLIKDSALVSTIAVTEMLWRARRVGAQDFRMLQALIIAAGAYWVLAIIFSALQRRVENRMAKSD